MKALLSIKPEFADKIFAGTKRYEFRRAVFKKEGVFNPETAQRFRDCILSKGGTQHPMTLYKNFKGSEPTIDALLERNGIK